MNLFAKFEQTLRDEMGVLINKYQFNAEREVWMSNEDIINYLYSSICESHELKPEATDMMSKISLIDFYIAQDRIGTYANNRYTYFNGVSDKLKSKLTLLSGYEALTVVKMHEVLKLDSCYNCFFKGNEGISMLNVLQGFRTEEEIYRQISALLDDPDFFIYKGYRHRNESDIISQTSENDLLVLCKKGLFTVEIKSGEHYDATIQSSGVLFYGGNIAKDNPVEQCVQHKFNLNKMLKKEGVDIGENIIPVLYLANCKAINNQFNQVEAYNSSTLLANSINNRKNAFDEKTLNTINEILKKNSLGELKMKYAIPQFNIYSQYLNFKKEAFALANKIVAKPVAKNEEPYYGFYISGLVLEVLIVTIGGIFYGRGIITGNETFLFIAEAIIVIGLIIVESTYKARKSKKIRGLRILISIVIGLVIGFAIAEKVL